MPRIPPEQSYSFRPRIYDILRAKKPFWKHAPPLGDMPVFVADSIAQQIDNLPDDLPPFTPESYGVITPPFREFFVEADTFVPEGSMTPWGVVRSSGHVLRGVHVQDMSHQLYDRSYLEDQPIPDGTRWMMSMHAYGYVDGRLWTYPGEMFIYVGDDGVMITPDQTDKVAIMVDRRRLDDHGILPIRGLSSNAVFCLKAINALHHRCVIDRVTPSRDLPRQQLRAIERTARLQEQHEYHIIRVRPSTGKSIEDAGKAVKQTGRGVRDHVVRGHFRWYGDQGMFGRLEFTNKMVWIPDHRRGTDVLGTIRKDYEIEG